MRLLVTTNARLYKWDNLYYTPLVYGYDFFKRYLNVFEDLRLVAHVEDSTEDTIKNMLLVSGAGIEVFDMPFPHGKIAYLKSALTIHKKAKKCVEGCDAALFRVPDPLAFQIIPRCKKKHIPVALEVTSDPLELYSAKGGRYPMRLFIKWSHYWELKKCCKQADCVSYVTSSYLQKVYPTKIKEFDNQRFETHYTTAGINEHEAFERKYPIEGTIKLLHVSGSIGGKVKGHKELVEAFIALRNHGFDVSLTLVGAGKLDVDILQELESSGYLSCVTFTGLVNKERLQELYKESDVFVFPSYREGLPRVVIEAMSWGLPCICSDIPGCRELLSTDALVSVKDTVLLIEKLQEWIKNQHLLSEASKNNVLNSQQYINSKIEKVRNRYYQNIRNLAEGKVVEK